MVGLRDPFKRAVIFLLGGYLGGSSEIFWNSSASSPCCPLLTCQHVSFVQISIQLANAAWYDFNLFFGLELNQLMENWWFAARWFGIWGVPLVPLSKNPFHFRGSQESMVNSAGKINAYGTTNLYSTSGGPNRPLNSHSLLEMTVILVHPQSST